MAGDKRVRGAGTRPRGLQIHRGSLPDRSVGRSTGKVLSNDGLDKLTDGGSVGVNSSFHRSLDVENPDETEFFLFFSARLLREKELLELRMAFVFDLISSEMVSASAPDVGP